MTALEKLIAANESGKFICVGLDTDIDKIPGHLKDLDKPALDFNKAIIDCTIEYAAAYKINFAFYEREGIEGLKVLKETLKHAPSDLLIIADAKRGDIGNTSAMYAISIFDHYNFDAVTLHPLMGYDSIEPFLNYKDKLNFILALTSNKGSEDFEKLALQNGKLLFQEIIEKAKSWNQASNCGIVFGATNSNELFKNVGSFGNLPVLLPGVGAQGGSLEDVVNAFKDSGRKNYLINVSRGIIYKSSSKNFTAAANNEIITLNNKIRSILLQ